MGNAHRKAKQSLKRAKKKKEARRLQTLSPFRRAAHGGQLECYRGRSDEGLASIIVLGHLAAGQYAMSGFLIDLWCVGLKDAWGQKQITRAIFENEVLPAWRRSGEDIGRASIEEVRKLIAGAVRFSLQNGFRLPEHWDRYAAILGEMEEIATADLSEFGVDGKLRYVGTEEFLHERLAKCSPAEFLARPDVEFVMQEAEFDSEDEADDEDVDLDEALDEALKDPKLAAEFDATAREILPALQLRLDKACSRMGVTPHPRLADAALLAMMAETALASDADPDAEEFSEADVTETIDEMLSHLAPDEQEEMRAGLAQFVQIAPNMEDDDQGEST
jgi:hypothetical protein